MAANAHPTLSIVVPVHNEYLALPDFHSSLLSVLSQKLHLSYEIIYCDDGSTDGSRSLIMGFRAQNPAVKLLALTRNFGKEVAVTAGLAEACGQAVITLDADGQHPVERLPEFVARWQAGSRLVIGLRTANTNEGPIKHYGSIAFYKILNRVTGMKLLPGITDYRLVDATILRDFLRLPERNRLTRGLLDWLGYDREYLTFIAKARSHGEASYSFRKLFKLSIDGIVSLSISPLYVTAYIGAFVLPASLLLGIVMAANYILNDPLTLHATAGAYVAVLTLFLVGILLVSQGIIGLYLSHIHTETQNRPLYLVDHFKSEGIRER